MTGPQCQRILRAPEPVLRRAWRLLLGRPAVIVQCGLRHDHGGKHVPFVPGDYLALPALQPLDAWNITTWRRWRCPDGCAIESIQWEPTRWIRFGDGWECEEDVVAWQFWPCGHEFRERLMGA